MSKHYAKMIIKRWVYYCNYHKMFSFCEMYICSYQCVRNPLFIYKIDYKNITDDEIEQFVDNDIPPYQDFAVRLHIKLKDDISLEKFTNHFNRITKICVPEDLKLRVAHRGDEISPNPDIFNGTFINQVYSYLTNDDNIDDFSCQSSMTYNGPVKMSQKSSKHASEMSIGDFLYVTPDGELVSDNKPENKPIACKFDDHENLFVSLNVLDIDHLNDGIAIDEYDSKFIEDVFIYYGCKDICFNKMLKTNKYKSIIKSSTSQLSGTYQIALYVINKNNAEINWK